METNERLRQLPQVDALLRDPRALDLIEAHSRPRVAEAVRAQLDDERRRILDNGRDTPPFSVNTFFGSLQSRLDAESRGSLCRVINATGTVLHTNLGRAPLADDALRTVTEVAAGYSNLEYDLATGERGSRYVHVERLLCQLTGAEAALVVNNNAAAVTLAVNTFAKDGEVVTSRGELVEIGGSFRIPEVIERSEAELVEVGTTNKTRADDFARAITAGTRILLKVHPSNYKIVGFTESASREAIVAIARERGLVAMEDLGSGSLVDLTRYGLPHEPTVQEAVAAEMDLVTFSGDKLLGGPQAGVVVGRAVLIAQMKRNPLLRALRIDKLSLAALDATLRLYLNDDALRERLPVMKMLTGDLELLKSRADALCNALNDLSAVTAELEPGHSYAGGGALPEEAIPTHLVCVSVDGRSAQSVAEALRHCDPPVVARISEERVVFDLRTVSERDDDVLAWAIRGVAS